MTHQEAYSATLERLRADLAAVEGKAERLRAGINAIESIIAADAAAPSAHAAGVAHASATPVVRDHRLKAANLEQAALIGFHHAARPLHVRELFDTLVPLGYDKYREFKSFRNSMTPALDRSKVISKVGSGLYQPNEWAAPKSQLPGRELDFS